MLASAMTFPVVDLAQLEAKRFENQRSSLQLRRPLLQLFIHLPVRMFVSFVERKVDNVARDLAHQTLFFRGARKSLVDPEFIGNEFIDVSSDLLDALDIMQRNLMEMRKNTLALIEAANVDTLGQLRQALQRMASAAAELFDEVTAFRGELLACEADYTARRDGLAACTHEDLDEVFRKIASDA